MTPLAQLGDGEDRPRAGRHACAVVIAGPSPVRPNEAEAVPDGAGPFQIVGRRRVEVPSLPLATGVARRWIVRILGLSCLVLVPWTIGLAVTLPRSYLVGNWPLAWTGFDLVLLGCLSTTAWALWRRRVVAVPAAMASSVVMLCDAWFDIVTAHGGRCLTISIMTAGAAEVPLAILLGWVGTRLLRDNLPAARGPERLAVRPSLWRTPLAAGARATPAAITGPMPGAPRFGGATFRLNAPVCRATRPPAELGKVTVGRTCSRRTSHQTERTATDEHQNPHT